MNDNKMTPGELRDLGFGDRILCACRHVYGSAGSDHLRHGVTGRKGGPYRPGNRHLRLAQAIFQIPSDCFPTALGVNR